MRGIAVLLTVGSLLALAGCEPERDECRRAYPEGSAAYNACWRAVWQRQNERLDEKRALELRARF